LCHPEYPDMVPRGYLLHSTIHYGLGKNPVPWTCPRDRGSYTPMGDIVTYTGDTERPLLF